VALASIVGAVMATIGGAAIAIGVVWTVRGTTRAARPVS
jgi:hypothetical protein